MTRFTKEKRAEIATAFARENGGRYDAAAFVEQVEHQGRNHPAYEWFQWDDATAAHQHRIQQARLFVHDLRIKFEIVDVRPSAAVKVRTEDVPLFISPMERRNAGGGYDYQGDGLDMPEHCRQAATSLVTFLRRYSAALVHVGIREDTLRRYVDTLMSEASDDAAA